MPAPLTFAPRLLQATAAAYYLGVSVSKFRTLGIPAKIAGGNKLFDRLDLDAWVDALPYDDRAERNEADAIWGTTG